MQRRFFLVLFAAAILLSPAAALAAEQGTAIARLFSYHSEGVTAPGSSRTVATNLLEAAPLNGAAATLTVTLTLGDASGLAQYSQIKLAVQHTHSAATTVTLTYYCSLDGTNYSQITSRAISAGEGVASLYVDTVAAAASASPLIVVDVRGCYKYRFVAAATGTPAAGDLITVQGVAVVGK